MKGLGKPAGAVYAAMTSKPEYSNRNYLALENASKPEAVYPCVRRGCSQFVDVEGSEIQSRVSTPCAPGLSPAVVGAKVPPAPVSVWVADLRCGGARDCVGQKLFSGDRVALEGALRSWTAVGGGRGGVVRPRAQGEEITY